MVVLGFGGALKVQFEIPRGIYLWLETSPPLAEGLNSFRQFFSPILGLFVHLQEFGHGQVFLGGRYLHGRRLRRWRLLSW